MLVRIFPIIYTAHEQRDLAIGPYEHRGVHINERVWLSETVFVLCFWKDEGVCFMSDREHVGL